MSMVMPLFRYASSRIRSSSVSYLYSVTVKMEPSGWKVILVPCLSVEPTSFTAYSGLPLEYSCWYIVLLRKTCTIMWSLKALTQLTPTPCRPPETL